MSYEEPTTEHEILSADEQKVRQMCISLKRIDAPKDFDFKLKARIAQTKPTDFEPRFGYALRYALPVFLMIFVLSFAAYNSGVFSSSKNNQVMAESSPEKANPSSPQNTLVSSFSPIERNENQNENSAVSNTFQNLPKVSENDVAENNLKTPKIEKKRDVQKDNFSGSALKSVKPPTIIQPNSNFNAVPQKPQNLEKTIALPVQEILAQFGIRSVLENGAWIVKSVVQNSVGESSGIKENDIVEAIDNQTVSDEPVSAKNLNVEKITVRRNGGKLQIKLRNKQ